MNQKQRENYCYTENERTLVDCLTNVVITTLYEVVKTSLSQTAR